MRESTINAGNHRQIGFLTEKKPIFAITSCRIRNRAKHEQASLIKLGLNLKTFSRIEDKRG